MGRRVADDTQKPYIPGVTWNGLAAQAIRIAQKLGLRDLERLTGINRGYLSRAERNEIRDPGPANVKTIAEGLQVDPKALDPDWVDPDPDAPREEQP